MLCWVSDRRGNCDPLRPVVEMDATCLSARASRGSSLHRVPLSVLKIHPRAPKSSAINPKSPAVAEQSTYNVWDQCYAMEQSLRID
jgi:hypothetical protein